MRCIFCKSDSSSSKSVEHIIPESLGNKEHVLKNGIVCDKCNQYIAIKIEKPVLENPYFISVRHRNFIESKKNKIPLEKGTIGRDPNIYIDVNSGTRSIIIENSETVNKIISGQVKHMFVPTISSPTLNNKDLSRFLGKIVLEVLAHKAQQEEDWINEIVDKTELDLLRQYVRIGNKPDFWEYHQRRLYNEEDRFYNPKVCDEPYEVLHEFTLLYTDKMELYLILAIMGIEYALNFTEPKIEGYIHWLKENDGQSPLLDSNEKRIINLPENHWKVGEKMNFLRKE